MVIKIVLSTLSTDFTQLEEFEEQKSRVHCPGYSGCGKC